MIDLVWAIVAAYVIGAIAFALLVGRALRGIDVRRGGSGNVGTLNTFRSAGWVPGVLIALLDGLKAANTADRTVPPR